MFVDKYIKLYDKMYISIEIYREYILNILINTKDLYFQNLDINIIKYICSFI